MALGPFQDPDNQTQFRCEVAVDMLGCNALHCAAAGGKESKSLQSVTLMGVSENGQWNTSLH